MKAKKLVEDFWAVKLYPRGIPYFALLPSGGIVRCKTRWEAREWIAAQKSWQAGASPKVVRVRITEQ